MHKALAQMSIQLTQVLSDIAGVTGQRGRYRRRAARHWRHEHLFALCGVDLTRINGINEMTAFKVLAEVGPDMTRFPSTKHFASWLGRCPGTRISGGKVLSSASKRSPNRAAQALRLAAVALRNSQSALGAYYRRLCMRLDKPRAITAAAHKLARLIYALLTKGTEYVDQGELYYEERYRQRVLHHLTKRAQLIGYSLVLNPNPT